MHVTSYIIHFGVIIVSWYTPYQTVPVNYKFIYGPHKTATIFGGYILISKTV